MLPPCLSPFGLHPPLLSRPSDDDPLLIGIPGVTGVAIPNATLPSAPSALVTYRWPQTLMLREMILVPTSGLLDDALQLGLRIVDQEGDCVFDGTASTDDTHFFNPATLMGILPAANMIRLSGWTWSPQWLPFTRLVRAGDEWAFQLTNVKTGGGSITPRLLFAVERPLVEPPPPVRSSR